MRRVAQELNVGTMSLYYYVKTKDDIAAVMDDALLGETLLPALPKGWKPAMMAIARHSRPLPPPSLGARLNALRSPWPQRHASHGAVPRSTRRNPHDRPQKIALLATIDYFVFGHALREAAKDTAIDTSFAAAQLATGAFPRIAKIFAKGRIKTSKDRFEQGLQALLNGAPV